MRPKKETPTLAGMGGKGKTFSAQFATSASIRRRFGSGIAGYEYAKSAWIAANQGVESCNYSTAMRRIARAVGV